MLRDFGPFVPQVQPGDLERIAVPIDFLGVNYYTRTVVRHNPAVPPLQAEQVQPEGVERSPMWEVYPEGMGRLLRRLADDYRPAAIYVTENGTPLDDVPDAQGQVQDQARVSFLRRHLAQVHGALGDGVPVRGYFVWSMMDNFEWALGYRMRFGLVHVDFATLQRTPKASAEWYRGVIATSTVV
jgi:beta-glucosidase